MSDYQAQRDRISDVLDYEQEALDSLRRSWELEDRECQALALADAQVWATLHLARTVRSSLGSEGALVPSGIRDTGPEVHGNEDIETPIEVVGEEWPGGLSDGLTLPCSDCERVPAVDYLVTDEEWRRVIGSEPDDIRLGVVCIECFVARGGDLSAIEQVHVVDRQGAETLVMHPSKLWRY